MAARGPGIAMRLRLLVAGLLQLLNTLSTLTAAEIKANAGQLRAPMAALAAASALLMVALTLLLVAGVLALAQLVGALAACLIVAAVAALAGWALGNHALSRLGAIDLAPRRSIATLQKQVDRLTNADRSAKGARNDDNRHD